MIHMHTKSSDVVQNPAWIYEVLDRITKSGHDEMSNTNIEAAEGGGM